MPTVNDAYDAYKNGDMETALLNYMLAAERGYEVAQLNVAYLLDTSNIHTYIYNKNKKIKCISKYDPLYTHLIYFILFY